MKKVLSVVSVVGLLTLVGCGGGSDGDNGSNDGVSTFETVIAGPGSESGKLSVTIDARVASAKLLATDSEGSGPVTATGTLTLVGGSTVSLAGTFDPPTGSLTLSGGGYTFDGVVSAGELSGTYTAPAGGSGSFAGADSSDNAVNAYVGTYSGDGAGTFNMVISSDGRMTGVGGTAGEYNRLSGTVDGNSLTGQGEGGDPIIRGTLDDDSIGGTWTSPDGTHGTWQGTRI